MRSVLLFVILVAVSVANGQTVSINNFDAARPDTILSITSEGGTVIQLARDTVDKVEGAGSLREHAVLPALHDWGTFAEIGDDPKGDATWDWSSSDSLSLWLKVINAPAHPENVVFRIHIVDRPDVGGNREEWIYENTSLIDGVNASWVNLRIPLRDRVTTGVETPDSTGFIPAPTNWGMSFNNKKFDRDKIAGWRIVAVTTANVADSITIKFDRFERFGNRPIPLVLFTGMDFVSTYTTWTWGGSALTVESGKSYTPNGSAIKWTQGDEWSNGWTGWGGDIVPHANLIGAWKTDSVKFKMKCDTGVGPLRAQFESPGCKRGIVFAPPNDTLWHSYAFKLSEMYGPDGTATIDSGDISIFGIMAEASAKAGKVIYITDLWTGNPTIDVIAPVKPTGVSAVGISYQNLITWTDTPGEPGAKYNVYYADHAWTNYKNADVEDVPPYGIPTGTMVAQHVLRAPNTDRNLTYYYGVTAADAAGNVSDAAVQATPSTTLAKGVPTIALAPPASFAADGNLTEWTSSSIRPFILNVDSATAHIAPNGVLTNSADLSAKAWIATDANYLYVAFDVVDDIVAVDTTLQTYQNDSPDLFIGLYDWRGKHHKGLSQGTTPDYHLRFCENLVYLDNIGKVIFYAGNSTSGYNPNYRWKRKTLTSGYTVEAKLSWVELAAALNNSSVFSPVEGMRIPLDFAINDRDADPTNRDCILGYSIFNDDNSWQDQWRWMHTWIGNKMSTTGVVRTDELPHDYSLGQNYPNPFNPTTQISYTLRAETRVSLRVFDMLGRQVAELVSANQMPGSYVVTFNPMQSGTHLSSGVYFYRLEAGSFTATKKMMLLK